MPIVNHKDGNKLNNSIENLEWCNYSYNNYHAYRTELKKRTNGVNVRQKFKDNLPNEQWKQYKDTCFEVSNLGRIKNNKTNNLLKGKINLKGYVEFCLSINGNKKSFLGHRIIYEVFKGNIPDNYVINHIDGNKTNNKLENLEAILPSENINYSFYKIGHSNVKVVGKFSKDGILLEKYPSCAEAARKNKGCSSSNISRVCNGFLKSHHGFIWKYLNE